MERKVNRLSQTTQLLTKKVTGVNFYLKDISHTSKIKSNNAGSSLASAQSGGVNSANKSLN